VAAEIIPLDLSRIFEHFPVLETERLVLRELIGSDTEDLFAYYGDPSIKDYVSYSAFKSIDIARDEIGRIAEGFKAHKFVEFGVARKSDNRIVGVCTLHHISPDHHRMELGYGLARAYWGFGYMTEAVREVIRYAFEEMGIHRIEAECETGNIRSCRVAERCGMTLEVTRQDNEINKGRFVSNHVYAIIRK